MTNKILQLLQEFSLLNKNDRSSLALSIQQLTNYYSLSEIETFINEMKGLNLRKEEDRQIFVKFLNNWIPLGDRS